MNKSLDILIQDLTRQCPECKKKIIYKNKCSKVYAEKRNSICFECSQKIPFNLKKKHKKLYSKKCPNCGGKISYTTMYALNKSIRLKTICRGCEQKGENNHQYGIKHTLEYKKEMSKRMSGKKNGFYGKSHSKKTKRILRIAAIDRINEYGVK